MKRTLNWLINRPLGLDIFLPTSVDSFSILAAGKEGEIISVCRIHMCMSTIAAPYIVSYHLCSIMDMMGNIVRQRSWIS